MPHFWKRLLYCFCLIVPYLSISTKVGLLSIWVGKLLTFLEARPHAS